jgi:hypothetical protein
MPENESPTSAEVPTEVLVDVTGAVLRVRCAPGRPAAEVRPHNPSRRGDVDLAARTSVERTDGRLSVRTPRGTVSRLRQLIGPGGDRVDVVVTVPPGSSLEVRGWADVVTEGPLGRVDVDTSMGDVEVERAAQLRVRLSMGDVRVGTVDGPSDLRTSAGGVRVGHAVGEVSATTAAGDVRVVRADDGGRLQTSAGDVVVGDAAGSLALRTSAGDLTVERVRAGRVQAETPYGRVEVGVARGTAAWLDTHARHGVVRSDLETADDGPQDDEATVEIHATTGYGDIVLRRA